MLFKSPDHVGIIVKDLEKSVGYNLELVQVAYYNAEERAADIADYKKSRGWA